MNEKYSLKLIPLVRNFYPPYIAEKIATGKTDLVMEQLIPVFKGILCA